MPKYTIEFRVSVDASLDVSAENADAAYSLFEQSYEFKKFMDAVRYCDDAVDDVYLNARSVDVVNADETLSREEVEGEIYQDDRWVEALERDLDDEYTADHPGYSPIPDEEMPF